MASQGEGALRGVKVLDLSRHVAGPCAAMYLGDQGADVIKVEPIYGDDSRAVGAERIGDESEFSPLFLAYNRNKRGISVDLKSPSGVEIVLKLAATTDVVLQNFLPGVANRLGVGYEQIKAVQPKIIYCNVSGWGQTGPLHDHGAYDDLIQAYAGPTSMVGNPGEKSVRIGIPSIDVLTGAHAAIAMLSALYERTRSGEGQEVNVSLYDTALHLVSRNIAQWTGFGVLAGKEGRRHPGAAPYGIFDASDREFYLGIANDRHYVSFCTEAKLVDFAEDPRYQTNRDRVLNKRTLYAELEPIFAKRPATYWVEIGERAGIPTTELHNMDEVVGQEQATGREMIVDTGIKNVQSAGIPIKLNRTPGALRLSPPSIGSHTQEILHETGYSDSQVEDLIEQGIVRAVGRARK